MPSKAHADDRSEVVTRQVEPYVGIPMRTILDPRLTMQAHAVLHYMILRAGIEGWKFYVSDIVRHFNTGQKGDAVRAALKVLETFGYIEVEQLRDGRGRMVGNRYHVRAISPSTPPLGDRAARAGTPADRPASRRKFPQAAQGTRTPASARSGRSLDPVHLAIAGTYNTHCGDRLPREDVDADGQVIVPTALADRMQAAIGLYGAETTVEKVGRATQFLAERMARNDEYYAPRSWTLDDVLKHLRNWSMQRGTARAVAVAPREPYAAPDTL